MSEVTTPRLMAAAKEFNIGKDTLVDFLESKGFSKDDLKPTSKLTEEMYRALQQEFQSDKVAKLKSDQIDLPKGGVSDAKKKKDEEEAAAKAAADKKLKKEEDTEDSVGPVSAESVAPVVDNWAASKADPEPELPKAEETPVAHAEPEASEATVPTTTEEEAPRRPVLEGPKVLDKIDLSAIDSSTRPKKTTKKDKEEPAPVKREAPKEETQVEPEPATQEPMMPVQEIESLPATEQMVEEAEASVDNDDDNAIVGSTTEIDATEVDESDEQSDDQESDGPQIENIKSVKLEGPKILGKIQLPVDNDTRPKPGNKDEKRKRKRIPIEKKGDVAARQGGNQQGGQGGGNRSGQQGGGQGNRQGNQQGNQGGNNRPPAPGGGRTGSGKRIITTAQQADREIDQKEIQEKIRQTQAKLSGGGGRGKGSKAKYRREKRELMAEQMGEMGGEDNKLQVTEFISVSELANLMDVSFAEVISKCMGLGIMVSINQRLDAEVIELVASEFGFEVEFIGMDEQMDIEEEEEADAEEDLKPRAPIVTIMGHVDHGKTSLLDYIRNANVIAGEAGGITQHIGAYEVTLPNGKRITFLDTPGHEAFTAMRARGAKVTDIAVIVIAADDAVMPQTKEAISHAQAAGVPMIFAINKIDKDGANPQRIYEQLAGMNLLVEEWGGKFQSQELSAKQGLNVDLLLEKILLEAELLDLKANPNREATGTIIEASLDKGRGYVATVLVLNGTLKSGDTVVSGQFFGKVKAMFNERNVRTDQAPPAAPALILGLNGAPQAGEKFKVYEDESEAKDIANRRAQILREQGMRTKKHITLDEIGRRLALGNFKELNLIIKGDVDGSVEALTDSLQKLSTEEIQVRVVHKGVGQITESDVLLATASDAIVVGFNVRPSAQANRLAQTEGVEIQLYSIIYTAIEEIKSAMEGMLEPQMKEKITANVEVREVYKFDKATVAGCYVLEGKIFRNSKVRLIRDGIVVYPTGEGASAELGSLKRFKDDVKEVASHMECGLTFRNYSDIRVGDIVEVFEMEEVKRTL